MPYRVRTLVGHFIAVVRWPVFVGLLTACFLQFVSAFTPALKPDQIAVPDLLPPVNTAVLALLWWRVSQLEKFRDRYTKVQRDELEDRRTQDRRRIQDRE